MLTLKNLAPTPPSRQFRDAFGNERGDKPVSRQPSYFFFSLSDSNLGITDGSALISPSIPLPIDRSVLETELQRVSPEMQRYIKHLLRQYEESYTGQAGEIASDQR